MAVLNSMLPQWQPMELSQYWHDMLAPANATNYAAAFLTAKTLNQAVINTGQQ